MTPPNGQLSLFDINAQDFAEAPRPTRRNKGYRRGPHRTNNTESATWTRTTFVFSNGTTTHAMSRLGVAIWETPDNYWWGIGQSATGRILLYVRDENNAKALGEYASTLQNWQEPVHDRDIEAAINALRKFGNRGQVVSLPQTPRDWHNQTNSPTTSTETGNEAPCETGTGTGTSAVTASPDLGNGVSAPPDTPAASTNDREVLDDGVKASAGKTDQNELVSGARELGEAEAQNTSIDAEVSEQDRQDAQPPSDNQVTPAEGERGTEEAANVQETASTTAPEQTGEILTEPVVSGGEQSTEATHIEPESNTPDNRTARGTNFRFAPGEVITDGSFRDRAHGNLAAIRLLKTIQQADRHATPEEQRVLARYVGWGASELANGMFPNPRTGEFKDGWKALGEELRSLLSPEEYAAARRTTQYAHYTPEFVIRNIYAALRRFGFEKGLVIEPGMGTGLFAALMPEEMAVDSRYTGIEFDPITGGIAKLLQPKSDIRIQDFTETKLPGNFFDIAVGNPPFSDIVVSSDPDYKKHKLRLHDYFFAKTIDSVRPGGLLCFVTSRGTMDKASDTAREYLAERADLIGAIRLPETAFKANAGTDVVVDILFLRKRLEDEQPGGQRWTETKVVRTPEGVTSVNEYYVANPEMVLGSHSLGAYRYGSSSKYTVLPTSEDLAGDLAAAVERLPENIFAEGAATGARAGRKVLQLDIDPSVRKEGSYHVTEEGTLVQIEGGLAVEVQIKQGGRGPGLYRSHADLIIDLIPVRDAVKQVLHDQLHNGDWAASQVRLNSVYDAFVAKHGPINKTKIREETDEETGEVQEYRRQPNLAPFLDDPDAWTVAGIEEYDEEYNNRKGRATKRPIFHSRVIAPPVEPDIRNVHDALHVVLNEQGSVDIDEIAHRAGLKKDEAIAQLGTAVFLNPANQRWETLDDYLSGDVRAKLKIAESSAKADPRFAENVKALQEVQPKDLNPSEITARLGSPWIPSDVIEKFIAAGIGPEVEIKHIKEIAAWSVSDKYSASGNAAATTEWGTDRRNALELIEDALNARTPSIYDTWTEDGKEKRELNSEATEAARTKLGKIKTAFEKWVWSSQNERSVEMMRTYNDLYNNIVPRHFNGEHLTLPGSNPLISLHRHQRRVVWRIIQAGSTYMAHRVGAGKTMAMIAAGMEMKRLGLITKPMYCVPNHMLKQFSREFLALYPGAQILVADEVQFHKSKRRKFMGKVATGNWDAVIITHSAFHFIPVSNKFEQSLIDDLIEQYREILEEAKADDERLTVKRMEKEIQRLEERLEGMTNHARKDRSTTFEETGIDFLFVDEAQEFRKLQFATNQSSIKGIDPHGSQRAWDLYVKTRYLESRRPGRSLVLASGTPVTNTIGEMFTIQRYLTHDELEKRNIGHFDAWSAMFGDMTSDLEMQPSGKYKMVSRFAHFVNIPEIIQLFRYVADVVGQNELSGTVKLPSIKGGRRRIIRAKTSKALKRYQKVLDQRLTAIAERRGPPKKGDDIVPSVINDGRHAAIDMRFISPHEPRDEESKLSLLIRNVYDIWERTSQNVYRNELGDIEPKLGATQLIFSDLGTPSILETRGFSAYHEIRDQLIAMGVPREQIAFMQDYKKSEQKIRLFNDMNSGKIRILIGSSQTMGTGVNVQKRLIALHHLDAPWLPSDVEQREGRILRQGNQNPEVELYAYATLGSLDATMWQTLERKQKFIDQIMAGDTSIRTMEDLDSSQANQFAIAKAMASGDERLMQKAGIEGEIARLMRLRSAHFDEQMMVRSRIRTETHTITRAKSRISEIEQDLARRIDTRGEAFSMVVDGRTFTERPKAAKAFMDRLNGILMARVTERRVLATIGGFDVVYEAIMDHNETILYDIRLDRTRSPDAVFVDENRFVLEIDHTKSATGAIQKMEHAIQKFDDELTREKYRLETAEKQLKEFSSKLNDRFEYQEDLDEKVAELARLEEELQNSSGIEDDEDEDLVLGVTEDDLAMMTWEGEGGSVSQSPFNARPSEGAQPAAKPLLAA